jgi:hypothetical protein
MTAAGPEVENGTRFLSLSLCLLLCRRRRRVCRVRRADESDEGNRWCVAAFFHLVPARSLAIQFAPGTGVLDQPNCIKV